MTIDLAGNDATPRFRVDIMMGNDAMQTPDDVADALIDLARRLRDGDLDNDRTVGHGNSVRDVNGNTVGEWGIVGRVP